MNAPSLPVRQAEQRRKRSPLETCRELRRGQPATVLLDGSGGFDESWRMGPIVAVRPEACPPDGSFAERLDRLDDLVRRRRSRGGTAETGIVVLLSYEALRDTPVSTPHLPQMVVFRVDASLRFLEGGNVLATRRGPGVEPSLDDLCSSGNGAVGEPVRRTGRPRTSLPRERYLRSVESVQRHIARGDIYQANLCQQFSAPYDGDMFELYAALVSASPAPQSAFVEWPGGALVSFSPEIFLRGVPPDRVLTWPIKGTRPRGSDPAEDAALARALLGSAKDRAELLMIVDLERNDLSRVCRPGSVQVGELATLRSYAAVHHLVARIEGRLRAGVGPAELIRATFPGGSISGAPKIRAMQILTELEPVARHWFTGSLFWFADDGSLDSSILIRSWFSEGRTAYLGAGGGIVADSDPEEEWHEANVKARALARGLGFEPEEAV